MFVYAIAGLIGTVHETIRAYLAKGMFEYRNGSILTPFNYVYGLRVGHRHRAAPYRPGVEGRAGQPVMELCERTAKHRRAHHRPVHAVLGVVVLSDRPFHPAARPVARASHRRHVAHAARDHTAGVDSHRRVVTLPAIFLYGQRANGVVFDNWFAQHIGRLFDSDFMRLHFPNMRV